MRNCLLALICTYSTMVFGFHFNNSESSCQFAFLRGDTPENQTVAPLLATETLTAGAFIINMGVTPQTVGNGLKPYGMIYDLVKNYAVPIKWVINPGKGKDGIDFSYGGTDFKGGPFIIESEFRTAAVNARITYWQSQGVVGVTTTSPITVPVYTTIQVMPQWTMDKQNGSIATGFFVNAGIPPSAHGGSSSTNWKLPSELTCCDDLFVMPHADPKWLTHGNLYTWNLDCNGSVWLGCHAGSALEDMFNPSIPSQQTNFLAEKTGVATGGGPWSENALLLWGNHDNGTLPYSYGLHDDPVMQFIGIIDAATQNGSEQIYVPTSAGWRPTTKVGVWDPDHPDIFSANPQHRAAVLAYGRGLGDSNRGFVMLEGSHSINKSTAPDNIAAQRAFFNFSLLTALSRAVVPEPKPVLASVGDTLLSGVAYDFTYDLPVGYDPADYSVTWSSTCGGSYAPNPNQRNVTFTAPLVSSPTQCYINIEITDLCGRKFNNLKEVIVLCGFSVSANLVNPACQGAATGSIGLNVSGAAGPFNWNWSRVSPAGTGNGTGTSITNLTAGTYNLTVTAANGCNKTLSNVVLTDPPALSASHSLTHVLCNGASTGAIDLSVSGGTPAYTYNWGGGINTQDRTGISAGNYSVTITDSKGCTLIHPATITEPAPIVISPTITHINCFGETTGGISLSITGGVMPLGFAWSDGPTSQNRTNLAAGVYTVSVSDASGCIKSASIAVNGPAAALSLSTSVTNIVCGSGSGAINLTVSGGTPPFSYSWADGPTTEDRSNLTAGNYQVTVTDSKGCVANTSAAVTETSGATLSSTVSHISCFGQKGSIDLSVSGVGPFTYAWADGAITEDRSNLNAGTYTVTVTSSEGCSVIEMIAVNGPTQALALSASMTNVLCFGQSTGAIDLTVSGGTAPYSYAWSNLATVEDISGLAAGTYSVTVTDNNGCTATLPKTITQAPALNLSVEITPVTCPPTMDGAIVLSVSGGTPSYTFDWDNDGFEPVDDDPQNLGSLAPGTYTVEVTDGNGCTATIAGIVPVSNNLPNPVPAVNHQ